MLKILTIIFNLLFFQFSNFADNHLICLHVGEGNKLEFSVNGSHEMQLDHYLWQKTKESDYCAYIAGKGKIAIWEKDTDTRYFLKERRLILNMKNGFWELQGKSFPGKMEIVLLSSGKLSCNVYLPMKDYLKGVLNGEMGAWKKDALEALKAQAVASRSYYYFRKLENEIQMNPTISFQHYLYSNNYHEDINKAIDETENFILAYKGKPALTVYSADCGGYSASSREVWGNEDLSYLQSRWDGVDFKNEFCSEGKRHIWKANFSNLELRNLLRKQMAVEEDEWISDIRILERGTSGRVIQLLIKTNKRNFILTHEKIRTFFKTDSLPQGLNSRLFDIEFLEEGIVINGMGFGHGAGMCQCGALKMAKLGYNYQQILNFYFPGTKLMVLKKGG